MAEEKLSLFRILNKMTYLVKAMFLQIKLFAFYAFASVLVSLLLGQWRQSCMIDGENWWCDIKPANIWVLFSMFLANTILQLVIYCSFGADIFAAVVKKQAFSFKTVFLPTKNKFLKMLVLFSEFLLFVVPIVGVMTIMLKRPNPDWMIEFCWFLLAFICCWLPFLALRMSSVVSYYLDDVKKIDFAMIWQKTEGRGFSIIFSFCIIFVIASIIQLQFMGASVKMLREYNFFVTAFWVEFFKVYIQMLFLGSLIMMFRAQQEILTPENSSPSDENTAMDSQKDDTALPEAENDNSRVKKSAKKAKAVKSRKNKKEKT